YNLNLAQLNGGSAMTITVESCHIQDLSITNSKNITVDNNQLRRLYFTSDTLLSVEKNTIYNNVGYEHNIRGILLNSCSEASVINNTITNYVVGNRSRGVDILNSKNVSLISNNIDARAKYEWTMGVYIEGGDTRNVLVRDNLIQSYYTSNNGVTTDGIYMDAGDSIYIKNNIIDGFNHNKAGHGISLYNIQTELEVDSNIVRNYQSNGIIGNAPVGSHWKVRNNTITNIRNRGLNVQGTGGL
ncbi:right-handed parallel beta-helix repeat-containing protein, partial [Carboxylicivirga marina]